MDHFTRRDFLSATSKFSGALAAGMVLPGATAAATEGPALPAAPPPPPPASSRDITMMNAVDLSQAIHAKRVSCREVMSAYLDHINRMNPKVNAIVSLQDPDALLKQADERDAQLARRESLGWMHGFPHAVKDLAPVKGIRTTFGSPLLDAIPGHDAIFVERLRKAGVIIIGKTNAPEFGLGSQTYNPVFGATHNAYDQSKCAGGSSGGAAVSLALRMLPVADGSDMMGSLRNPAAFNNVIGFRPSFGRVPSGPREEVFISQLSVEGPMGRSAADAAMLLSVMAGPDPRAPLSIEQDPAMFARPLDRDFEGTRIAWLGDYNGGLPMEPGVMDLCRQSFAAFESMGCTVEPALPDFSLDRLWRTWLTFRHWLSGGGLAALYSDPLKRAKMKPEAQWEVEGSFKLTAQNVLDASVDRTAWYQSVCRLFDSYDFLLLPSAQVFPFDVNVHWPQEINGVKMDTYHRWMEVVVPDTLSGCPAINVPVGFNAAGLPMGLQIIGPHHHDFAVLQIAHAYQQAKPWVRDHLPPLLG
ncbi:MAG TPA: amidase [Candidatus Acidoferrales bacterium]|nr:amidase [Candidatus Acidoferrales bacterium]